eukprot:evm.model.scf_1272.4 EVM.evm.TU.scf_1272.4   scf_1272:18516-20187(-)
MPNIKAPEYYEVTGEEPPKMPVVDENELINAIPSREAVPGLKKSRMAAEAEAERALAATGFQDQWREAGELEGDEAEEGGLDEIQSLQATGMGPPRREALGGTALAGVLLAREALRTHVQTGKRTRRPNDCLSG